MCFTHRDPLNNICNLPLSKSPNLEYDTYRSINQKQMLIKHSIHKIVHSDRVAITQIYAEIGSPLLNRRNLYIHIYLRTWVLLLLGRVQSWPSIFPWPGFSLIGHLLARFTLFGYPLARFTMFGYTIPCRITYIYIQ